MGDKSRLLATFCLAGLWGNYKSGLGSDWNPVHRSPEGLEKPNDGTHT